MAQRQAGRQRTKEGEAEKEKVAEERKGEERSERGHPWSRR